MKRYSVLDLAPVSEGSNPGRAFEELTEVARTLDRSGYHRLWLAEHHNMPGVASASPAVLIGHLAGQTERIRLGSGGVMLPNHAPLVVAEQFGTLAQLYPGRIDLGLGRAPGTDPRTARALRRQAVLEGAGDTFARDVVELIDYFSPDPGPIEAIPATGTEVPVWLLGSSLYSAELAALLGLPYAFASHFAPTMMEQAAVLYRERFQPSEFHSEPKLMMVMNLFAAETERAALRMLSSVQQIFISLRFGQPGRVPPPIDDLNARFPAPWIRAADQALQVTACGTPEQVREQIEEFVDRLKPDELMVTCLTYEHKARLESFEIGASVLDSLVTERVT